MKQYVLVQGSADYADEFDCEFFRVEEKEKWEKFQEMVEKYFSPFSIYFGTNEDLEFDSYKDWIRCLVVSDISESEYSFLREKFGALFGTGSCAISDDILDNFELPEEVADSYFTDSDEEEE
jgi:hypothetical protein